MGDLSADTQVSGGDGRYRGRLSPDWAIWGPNGGYLASVALRAVGEATTLKRPASFAGHYLNVAEFDEIDIAVSSIRSSKRAESLRVSMSQADRPIFEGLVWVVADGRGFEHDVTTMPEVPGPNGLRSVEEIVKEDVGEEERPPFPFWNNIDSKVVEWQRGRWEQRVPGPPVYSGWFRFRPTSRFDDPFVDAGRYVILVDTLMYPAATMAYPPPPPFMAPSLDLAIRFHRPAPDSEWLFCRAESPIAEAGLVGGVSAVYSEGTQLIASGGQQMLSRNWPGQG
jgi:acyl-CoA thioesterase-2